MKKNITLKCISFIAIGSCSVLPLILSSCSIGGIVFANYESYMSPDLIAKNRTIDGQQVRYVSYSTNEDIQAKFKRSYDIAVPSTYTVLELIKEDDLANINWSMFSNDGNPLNSNTYKPWEEEYMPSDWDGSYLIQYAAPYTSSKYSGTRVERQNEARNDPHNALTLFSDTVINIVFSVDDYVHALDEHIYGDDETLLNYSLPYFDEDLMFAYHGDYIGDATNNDGGAYDLTAPSYDETNNLWYSKDATWDKITDAISPNKNSNLDDRFKPSNKQHMALVDDSRSFYDLCHLASTNTNDVNPSDDEQTMQKIGDTYESVTGKFNPNTFFINSDSQQILYSFADPMGNPDDATEAQANGIISYSGDVAYAAMGGGNDDWTSVWNCAPLGSNSDLVDGNIHIVKPRYTMVALDMVVVNKRDQNSQPVYDLLKSCILDGAAAAPTSDDDADSWIGKGVTEDEDTNNPLYNTIINFEYTYYEPTLWVTKEFVSRNSEYPNPTNSYFDIKYEGDENKAELLAEINNVNFESDDLLLELPLSVLTKSNMSFEYMQHKEKM